MSNLEKYGYNPVQYKVLLRQRQLDNTIDGTQFIMPKAQQDLEQYAVSEMEVLAVGGAAFKDWVRPDQNPDAVVPQVGDWVITRAHAGFTVRHGDEEYKIATDSDIMAITEAPQ